MGTPARRRVVKPADVRTEELLLAAEAVFAARGIDATTIAEITERAGVAKGNFYRYFSSKEEILGALKARFYAQLIAEVDRAASLVDAGDWTRLVDAFVETIVDRFYGHAALVRVMARDATTSESTALFDCERALTRLLAAGIEAGVDAGAFQVARPHLTAALLQHGVIRTIEYALIYDEPVERAELLDAARDLVHRALANDRRSLLE